MARAAAEAGSRKPASSLNIAHGLARKGCTTLLARMCASKSREYVALDHLVSPHGGLQVVGAEQLRRARGPPRGTTRSSAASRVDAPARSWDTCCVGGAARVVGNRLAAAGAGHRVLFLAHGLIVKHLERATQHEMLHALEELAGT